MTSRQIFLEAIGECSIKRNSTKKKVNSIIFLVEKAVLHFEVRLGYRTHSDGVEDWHELITANATRILECIPPEMVVYLPFFHKINA